LARLRVDGEAAPDAVAHSIVEALSEELGVRSHEPTTHDGVP
jgi:hypothetical protein